MPYITYACVLPPQRSPLSRMDLYGLLFQKFLQKTGKEKGEIEGVFVTGHSLGMAEEQVIDYLKLSPKHCAAFDVGGATANFMLFQAQLAIQQKFLKNVVILGTGKFGEVDRESALRNTAHPDFEAIYGPSMPAMYALYAQEYMATFKLKREELALVPVATRKWANLNPDAFMHKKPLTVEEVVQSPPIATPFHLFDCSIPLDGGGLVFIEEKKSSLSPSISLIGYGEAHRYGYITTNENFLQTAAVISAQRALESAQMTLRDIQLLQIYDAFSICPLILLEDLGFYPKGEGITFFKEERGVPGGDLPLNTSGGLLSCGHYGMPAGFLPLVEAIRQLQGECSARQVPCSTALVHSYGGMFANHITCLLRREE